MPAVPQVLGQLVQVNVDANMRALNPKAAMAQPNPSYFIAFCVAIGAGIAQGSPLITFTTSDSGLSGAPPIPGAGSGTGIMIDDEFFAATAYTNIRNFIIQDHGSTTHAVWPPPADNSGIWLAALTRGVASAVKSHYATAWVLTSVHPTIYLGTGQIKKGNFSGLVTVLVQQSIQALGPQFRGSMWPRICQGIAQAYVQTIETQSTGTVTIAGVCVPSVSQVCGLPTTGSGSGTAA